MKNRIIPEGSGRTPGAGEGLGLPPPHLPAVLLLGVASQVGQILIIREFLMVFHGNELSMGLILASWLLWVGLGSRLGGFLAGRVSTPLPLLAATSAGVLVLLPATILLIRVLRGFFDLLPGALLSLAQMTAACFLLMAPACLLLGTQFVLLTRIWREREGARDTSSAGKTYVAEGAGSMLGGLLFTFLLVRFLNPFETAILVGSLLFASSLLIVGSAKIGEGSRPSLLRGGLVLLACAALSFPFWGLVDAWAYRAQWRSFTPEHQLVGTYRSKYGTIALVQREGQHTFYQSGHLIFSTAGPRAVAAGLEDQEAVTFAHLALVQHPKPRRLLLIGGGLRGVLGEILKHPVEKIDYIELDEKLMEAARPYVSPATGAALEDPRVSLIHADGRLFVKGAERTYDMVILDVPDPATAVLNRYYTKEFFRETRALLNPGGVLVLAAESSPGLRGPEVANRNAAIYHTLNSVFTRVLPAGERVLFFFASDDPGQISLDAATLQGRYREREISGEGFSPEHFLTLLQESQLRRVNWVLRNHGRSPQAPVEGPQPGPLSPPPVSVQEEEERGLPPVVEAYYINSDFKPIGYYYSLMFWDALTRPGRGMALAWLLRVQPWWVWPPLGLALLAVGALRAAPRSWGKGRDASLAVFFAVFTTGLATMALQIALLFSFQSIYGFVYETIGLIVALFMGGLSLGTFVSNRFIHQKDDIKVLALVQLAIALLALAMAPALPRAAALPSPAAVFAFFSLITFGSGFINGVDFPLATACCAALGRKADGSAAAVYGLELMGACGGAILASVVVAPVLGVAACCLLAAAANGTAFLALLLSRRSYLWLKKTAPPAA